MSGERQESREASHIRLVVGLGNPGRKYERTRHNIGFEVLAELARRQSAPASRRRFDAEVTEFQSQGLRVLLAAPQTYMNLSGRSVQQIMEFFRIPLDSLLVVCDDFHLETGRLRLRASGSAGGQKGLQNIIQHLGTEAFARLRFGVGQPPPRMATADYVLSRFLPEEQETIREAVLRAAQGVELWLSRGIQAAMNEVNRAEQSPRNLPSPPSD